MTYGALRYHRAATEAQMEATIREAVTLHGGMVWSVRDSRGLAVEHMPDLIVVLPPWIWFVELKSQRRAVTPGQAASLALLRRCALVRATVVRPDPTPGEVSLDDWLRGVGIDVLAGGAGERA